MDTNTDDVEVISVVADCDCFVKMFSLETKLWMVSGDDRSLNILEDFLCLAKVFAIICVILVFIKLHLFVLIDR